MIDASAALAAMRLPSLRQRMFDADLTEAPSGTGPDESSDITWL